MLVPGYFLVVSERHQLAMVDSDSRELRATRHWIDGVVSSLSPLFGNYLVFEHGSCESAHGGACVDHAHVHLIPKADQLRQRLRRALPWNKLRTYTELIQCSGTPYAYLGLAGEHYALRDSRIPSQWIRRELARHLGHDVWDWALDPGLANLEATLTALSRSHLDHLEQLSSNLLLAR